MSEGKKEANSTLVGVKFFFLTLFGLVALFCEMFLILPILSPKTAINIYKTTGLNGTAVATSERIYKKSNKISDLYNLILLADELNNEDALLKYSKEMLEREDFSAFATAFDKYAQEHTEKDKLYLVASLKSYLISIRIGYLYKENSEKAFIEAIKTFDEADFHVFYFSKYINCILLDNTLSDSKKNEMFAETATATHEGQTVIELLQQRYTDNKPTNLNDAELLDLELLWQLKTLEVELLDVIDDASYETARAELNTLATVIAEKLQ